MIVSTRGIRIRPEPGSGPWRADPRSLRGSVGVTLFVGDVRGGCRRGGQGIPLAIGVPGPVGTRFEGLSQWRSEFVRADRTWKGQPLAVSGES